MENLKGESRRKQEKAGESRRKQEKAGESRRNLKESRGEISKRAGKS
jgi:hypothetical protein